MACSTDSRALCSVCHCDAARDMLTSGALRNRSNSMITAYVACLIFGVVLTLASFVTGSSDGDAHAGGEHAHAEATPHPVESGLLAFLSIRFWMFSVTFFGLTGTGLTLLAAGGSAVIAA